MKFDTKYRIEEACSKDVTRPHLTHVELDVEGKRMMATNGHFAVSVPCEPETGDKAGPIQKEAIVEARRSAKRDLLGVRRPRVRARSKVLDVNEQVMYRRPKTTSAPIGQVLKNAPKFGAKGTVSVTLDPTYLVAAARAMGRSGYLRYVTVTFFEDKFKGGYLSEIGISVANESAEAVLMPARR